MANLTPQDINKRIPLAVDCKSATWFNPLNGDIYPANITREGVAVSLRSGESMILQTSNDVSPLYGMGEMAKGEARWNDIVLEGPWTLSFINESPKVDKSFTLGTLTSWETLDDQTRVTMGTGVYTIHFKMSKKEDPSGAWLIDLGDVRESARVYINGQFVGCAWSVPFVLDTKGALKVGDNEVRIEVTNLPANRIADLDRKGVKWRKMEEINVVDINYKKTLYDQWEPVPSGLNSTVKLTRNTK